MKLSYDSEADAVYLKLGDSQIEDSETVAPGVVLDYDANENIVGVELLGVSKRVTQFDTRRLLVETATSERSDSLRSGVPGDGHEHEHEPIAG